MKECGWFIQMWLLPVVHSIGRLIIGVDGILVTQLLGPLSLLIHVGAADELGGKVPTLTPRKLYVHSYLLIGLLRNRQDWVLKTLRLAGPRTCVPNWGLSWKLMWSCKTTIRIVTELQLICFLAFLFESNMIRDEERMSSTRMTTHNTILTDRKIWYRCQLMGFLPSGSIGTCWRWQAFVCCGASAFPASVCWSLAGSRFALRPPSGERRSPGHAGTWEISVIWCDITWQCLTFLCQGGRGITQNLLKRFPWNHVEHDQSKARSIRTDSKQNLYKSVTCQRDDEDA